ncbi:MAG: hypothetical protein R3322_00055 [Kiloniellales bacterium]|nr:hypothetical protein [Kiloniellales bacterium]
MGIIIQGGGQGAADFLEYVARLLRKGAVKALSIAMAENGEMRVSVVFADGFPPGIEPYDPRDPEVEAPGGDDV